VPHHGSRSSSGPRFVAAVGASLGVVSAGFGNRWGLPDTAVVARWRAAGANVLNTADVGAVIVQFPATARGIVVRTQRLETRRWWQRTAAR
ncbi:MAG: DNA internalization-related competence protein ComEC/Rec2, partial [Steroidobacteraceae bacterium]